MADPSLEKQLERLENRISAHTHVLVRAFHALHDIAVELDLPEIQTTAKRELEALKTLRTR